MYKSNCTWGKEHKTGKHTSKSGADASCDDDLFRLGIINDSGFGFRLVDIAQESCFVLIISMLIHSTILIYRITTSNLFVCFLFPTFKNGIYLHKITICMSLTVNNTITVHYSIASNGGSMMHALHAC